MPNALIIVQNLPVPFDRRVWLEATSLARAGFGIAVICPKKKMYTRTYEQLEGVDIYRYPLLFEASQGVAGYFVEFVYCWLASAWLAIRAYRRRPFHIIHACNPPDTYFALAFLFRILGVKFIFDHHDLCPEMYVAKGHRPKGLLYRALLGLERLTLRTADLVIAVNTSHKAIAQSRGRVEEDRIVVVRSGPPRAWANVTVLRPELKEGHRHMVMYLGEMCEQDGVDYLLCAIECYRSMAGDETLFVLVGGGPDQQRLKAKAEAMNLGAVVRFTGRVSDEDLWAYLSTADLCVDPDPKTEWSNLSTMNKIIEYMAFGRPIVAFDLLEHRRSAESAVVCVEPNNCGAFARAIHALLLDKERRRAMSEFGKKRFREALAWENSEQILVAKYRSLFTRATCPESAAAAVPER
jgi:glycosyltransferase involved in cell wall biosynthesis